MKTPSYLTKFPISIRKKKHSRVNSITGETKNYEETPCYDFTTRYGYFTLDRRNNIKFIITLVDRKKKCNYIIKVAKVYLYESLLLNLMYRPIRKEQDYNLYVHPNIKSLKPEFEMNKLTPLQIKERYQSAKESLEKIIENNSREKNIRTAEIQLEKLIGQQWKMELLYNIYMSEKEIEKNSA